jgi:hypothetical protein
MEGIKVKRIVQYIIPVLLASFVCGVGLCWAIPITADGGWSKIISSADLDPPYTAGSDLKPTYESSSNAVVINISNTAGNNWAVTVEKEDTWPDNLHLRIKRTSDGSGSGSISGGNSDYQNIPYSPPQSFFSGNGDRSGVTVQFELAGVSIQVPPGTYTTTVHYTVTVYDE